MKPGSRTPAVTPPTGSGDEPEAAAGVQGGIHDPLPDAWSDPPAVPPLPQPGAPGTAAAHDASHPVKPAPSRHRLRASAAANSAHAADASYHSYRSQRSTFTVDGQPEQPEDLSERDLCASNGAGSVRGQQQWSSALVTGPVVVELDPASSGVVVLPMVAASTPVPPYSVQPAAPAWAAHTLRHAVREYFCKWKGGLDVPLPLDSAAEVAWSWVGAFIAIAAVALLNEYVSPHFSVALMVASFGASAVLLFGVPSSKLAQPRNLVGGHVVSAIVGIVVRLVIKDVLWLSSALGMSLALTVMQLTRTTHPPGGATALIAASAHAIDSWQGFRLLVTVSCGSLVMLLVALVVNNLSPKRRFPTYWWG